MGKLGSECYKTTLCKRLAQPLSNALCRYAPILIVSYYSMFLWAASLIYLDIDQAKMIVLRLLENIFGVSVRVRASQKQPVVEWGCEALLFLLDFSFFFFFNIFSGNFTFYFNILQKVGRLVSSVPFSHPSGQQRWSYLKMKPVLGFFQQIFVAVVLGGDLCKEPWVDNGEVRKRNTKLPSCAQ